MNQKDLFLEKYESIDFSRIIDHPNILIAANFWEDERFQAACTCYKFMRAIDDLIDNHKAQFWLISDDERSGFLSSVNEWLSMAELTGEQNGMKK
jgi:hypothetical protein